MKARHLGRAGHVDEGSLVTRGDLSEDEIFLLDVHLAHHALPLSSAHSTPERVGFVCLACGSVGVSENRAARDTFTENFDPTCCGKTVWFHSDHRVLVDPSTLSFSKI